MQLGDKLRCIQTIYNHMRQPLCIEGQTYTVVGLTEESFWVDHILYGNQYNGFDHYYQESFLDVRTYRMHKLKRILNG
jgi:hypothetical protein